MHVRRAKRLAGPAVAITAGGLAPDDLLRNASRAELLALVAVLAAAADPDMLEAVTAQPGDALMRAQDRRGVLKRAHAERTRMDRAGLPVPPSLAALDSEYQTAARRQRIAAARKGRPWTQVAPAAEPEPCPSLPAYRRHKARGEDVEGCGCLEAARAVWRERKREAAREAADAA